ncbi:Transposase IS200 like protein [Rubripirellula lacrimiformis]|uniref:Transposase IS200 like protein n=1 Tax=Rubripirellula lacrimiformis TaxID=1930273 RepID=A0A517N989_9BACT|nr:transposase [Rubripirellula lacrimiformis]QDT03699.1 Transposase IS200 like protein [Rubripirellula lacrimiformis]
MTNGTFNLESPAGFRGLQPDIPVTMYQRHLPHWRQKGATYFVTFRLADALPQSKQLELKRWRAEWERQNPEPRTEQQWDDFARQQAIDVERWLDEGFGECVFASAEIADVLSGAMLHFQDQRCVTYASVVMPNHCHVVVKPRGEWDLEQILDSWKGFVGHAVNRLLGRAGRLWQEESYDRIVRDEEHLYRVIQYIGNNPRKAGLPKDAWFRWIHPDWEEAGWGFRDPQ